MTLALWFPCGPALAYIDPGTGSALFYVISGIILSIYFGIRSLYYRAIDLAFRVRRRHQRCDIAIHCEDPRYEITFLPVVDSLSKHGFAITFFSMYPRDDSFRRLPDNVEHHEIAPGILGYAYLNNIESAVLVTTTPQLDVMTFRRSRRVRHYAHIQHALGESRYVRPFAFDFFDSVLCCGPVLKKNLRRMEGIRGFPAKDLYETGIPHYEDLIEKAREVRRINGRPVVLVAPSWGPLSMFEAFGTAFVREIAAHFSVIVRPHPQMRLSQPQLYNEILAIPDVMVSTERTPADAMSRADILLSDISGITHEFAFIYERPVLIIDRAQTDGGLEGELLGGDSDLKAACRDFIVPIPPSEIGIIVDRLRERLKTHSPGRIVEARDQLVYNFGRASDVAAEQLAMIARKASQA